MDRASSCFNLLEEMISYNRNLPSDLHETAAATETQF